MSDDNEDLLSLQSFRRSIQYIATQGKKKTPYDFTKPRNDASSVKRSSSMGTDPKDKKIINSKRPSRRRSYTVGSSHSIAALTPTYRENDPILSFAGISAGLHRKLILERSFTRGLDGHGGRGVGRRDKILRDPHTDEDIYTWHPLQRRDNSIHFTEVDCREKIGHLLSINRSWGSEVESAKMIRRHSLEKQDNIVHFDRRNDTFSSTNPTREKKTHKDSKCSNARKLLRGRNPVDAFSIPDPKMLSMSTNVQSVATVSALKERQIDNDELQSPSPWAETKMRNNHVPSENRTERYLQRKSHPFYETDSSSFIFPSTASHIEAPHSSFTLNRHNAVPKWHSDCAHIRRMLRDQKNAHIENDFQGCFATPSSINHCIKARKDYRLGEVARSMSDLLTYSSGETGVNQNDYLHFISLLNPFDFAFIKRSNGQFTYAILADRFIDEDGKYGKKCGEECMRFVLSSDGTTKVIRRKFWLDMICLVNGSFSDVRVKI